MILYMTTTIETLAGIVCLSKTFMHIDGAYTEEELKHMTEFLGTFDGMDRDTLKQILSAADEMEFDHAVELIAGLDDEGKQEVSDLFARIVLADGKLADEEKSMYWKVQELCGLPDPGNDGSGEETKAKAEEEKDEDEIIPAFLMVNYHGIATLHQSEKEDWSALGDEIASWMGCDRVEVVRYTAPLNALTEKLNLNERHLVFMVARNGYGDKTVGDNMPATLLYGRGYPIFGNMVIALETDEGYTIEGIRTQSLVTETLNAVNDAVGGLIRVGEQEEKPAATEVKASGPDTFEDLAAVIAVCMGMARVDGSFTESEFKEILAGLKDQYKFEDRDELLEAYIKAADEMDIKKAIDIIKAFGPSEKQFASDMLFRTVAADGKLADEESDTYREILEVCELPMFTGADKVN